MGIILLHVSVAGALSSSAVPRSSGDVYSWWPDPRVESKHGYVWTLRHPKLSQAKQETKLCLLSLGIQSLCCRSVVRCLDYQLSLRADRKVIAFATEYCGLNASMSWSLHSKKGTHDSVCANVRSTTRNKIAVNIHDNPNAFSRENHMRVYVVSLCKKEFVF